MFSIDVVNGKQSPTLAVIPFVDRLQISRDGKQHAYTRLAGESYDIAVAPSDAPMEAARTLCSGCGPAGRVTADGTHLIYAPGVTAKIAPSFGRKIGLIEIATGKTMTWVEDPELSVSANTLQAGGEWLFVMTQKPSQPATRRSYFVPLRIPAPPRSEWEEIPIGSDSALATDLDLNFVHTFRDGKLHSVRFDPKARRFGTISPVQFPSGSAIVPKPGDTVWARGTTLVISRRETVGSVWTMKLPE